MSARWVPEIPGIPPAALARWAELAEEEKVIKKFERGLVGTQVPKVFYNTEDVIVNPSNVGTNILSRMIITDDSVWSSLAFMVLMIVSKIGEYHNDNEEIKAYVHRFLKRMRAPTWRQSMESMASHKGFGFSVSEICYGLNKDFQKVPVRIATYHPSTICFEVDSSGLITQNGILQYVLQYNQFANPNQWWTSQMYGWKVVNPFTTPYDRMMPQRIPFVHNFGLVRIPRSKVIHHINAPHVSFGNPYGSTEVRTAHLAWQLKVFLMRQMGIAGKRNATNALWATAPLNQNKLQYTKPDGTVDLLTPVEAMKQLMGDRESDDAIVTGPEASGYKLSSLSNAANLEDFTIAINFCDVKIFRCFLIPSLVMTDGSAGNRALGDKHFDVVNRIAENEAQKFGETLVNDLIERMIVENFGEQEDYGHFTQRPQSIEERKELCDMFTSAVNGGIMKPYSKGDMSYMRSSLSFPVDTDKSTEVEDPADVRPEDRNDGDPVDPKEPKSGNDPGVPNDIDEREREDEEEPAPKNNLSRGKPAKKRKHNAA